jgi:hypothetical protein
VFHWLAEGSNVHVEAEVRADEGVDFVIVLNRDDGIKMCVMRYHFPPILFASRNEVIPASWDPQNILSGST